MSSFSNFLLLRGKVSQAVDFYASVFGANVNITSRTPYSSYFPKGDASTSTLMSANMTVYGQKMSLFDFGPDDAPSKAVSFMITCDGGQAEVDRLWDGLSGECDGGKEKLKGETLQCGWVRDPFGFYWQVVPKELQALIQGNDSAKSQRVMKALWGMSKIEITGLENAANGEMA